MNPKILCFDLETMADLAWVWQKYDTNVISYQQLGYILTFAYKWVGERAVSSVSLPDFDNYSDDKTNDYNLCKRLWELFDEADVLVAHNGDQFDIKKAQARFAVHGFPPPKPFASVDTKKVAKRYFRFNSNKLDDLSDQLGIGRKMQTGGWDLWLGVAVRDEKPAWDKMIAYCKQDTALLEKVYLRLRPWMQNHPNHNVYSDTVANCPACGSDKMIRNGWRYTRSGKTQRFQCTACSSWSASPKSEQAVLR